MSLIDRLESRASQISSAVGSKKRVDPISLLEEQIAFITEQLQRRRALHKDLLNRLLIAETYIDNDLLKLEGYSPGSILQGFQAKGGLRFRLAQLDAERRHMLLTYFQDVVGLQDRLAQLLGQHSLLAGSGQGRKAGRLAEV